MAMTGFVGIRQASEMHAAGTQVRDKDKCEYVRFA